LVKREKIMEKEKKKLPVEPNDVVNVTFSFSKLYCRSKKGGRGLWVRVNDW
jgi:hypothetical protein